MDITYIGHSGFAIESDNGCTLVFDFFKDDNNVANAILKRARKLLVFASHSHPDHFNPEIFNWQTKVANEPHYILSNDIRKKLKRQHFDKIPPLTNFMHANEKLECNDFVIHSFESTDVGVSFLVDINGIFIFHAGDLNNWHWQEESTPQEIKQMQSRFLSILKRIKAVTTDIHVAMFPVDPRIGGDFSLGARQFVNTFKVVHFIPMHQWDDFENSCNFSLYRNNNFGNYHCMRDGDKLTIK